MRKRAALSLSYLKELFNQSYSSNNYNLRKASLALPMPKTEFMKKSFKYTVEPSYGMICRITSNSKVTLHISKGSSHPSVTLLLLVLKSVKYIFLLYVTYPSSAYMKSNCFN